MKQQTVTLNGVSYDVHTGMRITPRHRARRMPVKDSHVIHRAAQHSNTLNRQSVAKNSRSAKQILDITPHSRAQTARHPMVTRFAPDMSSAGKLHRTVESTADIAPTTHPRVAKAQATMAQKSAAVAAKPSHVSPSSHEIKQRVVSDALRNAPSHAAAHQQVKTNHKQSRWGRAFSIAGASFALLMLAGYFTYVNMPNLSVRVAAAQAGINASYPDYRPDGYSLHGPIAYDAGHVSMKFAATGGPQKYTVSESRSDWDSSAVEQNYAQQRWGDNTNTVIDHGLTIYTNGSEAAWVNGGIFYTITGNAPLSTDQVSHIATSL